MKKIVFEILKNSQFAKFAKLRMKTQFFPIKPGQTLFLLYTVIALLILKTEFGLIWKSHWPDEND